MRGNRPRPFGGSRSDVSTAAQGSLVLGLAGMGTNVGLLSLCRSRSTPHPQARNDQNQQNRERDDGQDDAHDAAEQNGVRSISTSLATRLAVRRGERRSQLTLAAFR